MKYHELQTTVHKTRKRVGRGIAAGRGKTAGRGTKGQKSRAGSGAKPGFAGGSNPIMQALPKLPGFKSHRPKAETIYTGQLEAFGGKTVDSKVLADAGLITTAYGQVKLLSKGKLTKKVTVKLPQASKTAIAAVESAGGSYEKTTRLGRPKTSKKKLAKQGAKAEKAS